MKYITLLFAISVSLWAQATDVRATATQTQVVLSYIPPSTAPCAITLSAGGALVPAVDPSLFAGSDLDDYAAHTVLGESYPGHERTVDATTGRRQIVIGQQMVEPVAGRLVSRAQRADTDHVGTICGTAFSVRTARIAGVAPPVSMFNSAGYGHFGFPDFDWTDSRKPVIDPQTGAAVYRLTDPKDSGFLKNQNLDAVFGGSGWTNTANIASGGTSSLASTSSNSGYLAGTIDTIAATVYGGFEVNAGWPRLASAAVRVFGAGDNATAANREVLLCLSVNSGQTCYTDVLPVTLPQTTAAEVGTAGVGFPTSFPIGGFAGWGRAIPQEYWTTSGFVTVSGSTVTLALNRDGEALSSGSKASGGFFRPEWVAGTKIFIAGSSAFCTANYCTIASVQNRTTLTITESGTIASAAAYKSAALAVRITKTTATGTVSVSLSSRLATYMAHHTGASDMCSRLPVSTTVDRAGNPLGRTITGRLCVINRARQVTGRLYFVGESEPEFRLLSVNAVPSGTLPDHTANESPSGGGFLASASAFFSATDPNSYYVRQNTQGGTPSVFRLTYSGNYRETSSAFWSYSQIGSVSAGTDPVTWTNILKGANGPAAQIRAASPPIYDETTWPNLAALQFGGIVDSKIFFYILQQGQDLPCAVFTFDAVTGLLERSFDTLSRGIGGIKFAGCHGLQVYGNRVFISARSLIGTTPFLITSTASRMTIGPECSVSNPCQAGTSGGNHTFTAPATVDVSGTCVGDPQVYVTAAGARVFSHATTGCTFTPSAGVTIVSGSTALPSGAAFFATPQIISAGTFRVVNIEPFRGPYKNKPTHVIRGGVPSTDTSLPEWTNGTYDAACPSDIPQKFKDLGATGNECVTMRFAAQPCNATPSPSELAQSPCPTDPARSWIGKAIEVGDATKDYPKSFSPGTDLDSETLTAVKVTPLTGTAFEVVFLRDSATGYACQIGRPRGRSCVAVQNQAQHANGWEAVWIPISAVVLFDPVSGELEVEDDALQRGHFNVVGLGGSNYTSIGLTSSGYASRVNQTKFIGAQVNTISFAPYFAGAVPSSQHTQSYGSAPVPSCVGIACTIASDWKHLNSAFGADWEIQGQTVGATLTYTLQSGRSSVYRISSISGGYDPKRQTLTAWAGHYRLTEKSGPGVILTDSDVGRICIADADGECQAGSSAGQIFAVIPNLETGINQCHASQNSYRTPCIFGQISTAAQVIQMRIDLSDPAGMHQRSIGTGGTMEGMGLVYSDARGIGTGMQVLSTIYHHRGWFTGPVLIDPGGWQNDNRNRTGFQAITLSGGSNFVVEFGYNANFHCAARAEACVAKASTITESSPFLWAGESGAYTPTGNTVLVPALPGRVVYFRRCTSLGVCGPTARQAVP